MRAPAAGTGAQGRAMVGENAPKARLDVAIGGSD
jgi:hypothetical protein